MKFHTVLYPVLLLLTVVLIGCLQNPQNVPTVPLQSNCVGIVRNANGSPVPDASVVLVPEDFLPMSNTIGSGSINATVTDKSGRFFFDVEKNGIYTILADDTRRYAIRQSVRLSTNARIELTGDTLAAPGSLSGRVRLESASDNRSAVVLFVGTNVYAMPSDSSGNFIVPALARGVYRLHVISLENGYTAVDTVVTVASGLSVTLPVIVLQKQHPPEIDSFSVQYDPAMMKATLAWSSRDSDAVASYVVYCNRELYPEPVATVASSVHTLVMDVLATPYDTLTYRITALDTNGLTGLPVSDASFVKKSAITYSNISVDATVSYRSSNLHISDDHSGNIFICTDSAIFKLDSGGILIASDTLPQKSARVQQDLLSDNNGNLYILYDYTEYTDSTDTYNMVPVITAYDRNLNFMRKLTLKAIPIADGCRTSFSVAGDGSIMVYYATPHDATHFDRYSEFDTTFIETYDADFNRRSTVAVPGELRIIRYSSLGNGDTVVATIQVNEWDNYHIVFFDSKFNQIRAVTDFGFLDTIAPVRINGTLSMCTANLWSIFSFTTDEQYTYLTFFNADKNIVARLPFSDYLQNIYTGYNGNFYMASGADQQVIRKYASDAVDAR